MAMYNVVIKRKVHATFNDADKRSVKCASDVENGGVFALKTRSTVDGEDEVWVATAPAAATDGSLWMAVSPEVVTTKTGDLQFRGIVNDPRYFTNIAGTVFDAIKLCAGDIIEIAPGDGISAADIKADAYLIPTAGATVLAPSATANTTGLSLHKVDTGVLHIGQAGLVKSATPTYIYEVEAN